MDLESETSAIGSVQDNGLATTSYSDHSKDKIETNGSCSGEIHNIGTNSTVNNDTLLPDGLVKEGAWSQSPSIGSPPVPKGYGLRKWRRIKRDFVKDTSPHEDNSKALKRVLSISGNPNKGTNMMSNDTKKNNMAGSDGLLIHGTSNESENSEDQSSKSSTAASAPRLRYDIPAGLGYSRVKNLSGKSASSSSTQRVPQGKGRVESSKKQRGERIKIEKENSHSSIESDSRSSNFVFPQGVRSVTSNGNQNMRSMYHDGENGENGDGSQDELGADASWEGKGDEFQNYRPSLDVDPLVESIVSLQSVQEALQSEVQKFRELGTVSSISVDSIFLDGESNESSSSEQSDAEMAGQSRISESQILSLTENLKQLESRLEKAEAMVKEKESRITELENSLTSEKSAKEESGNATELEQIFREKIEGEIEYLTLSRLRVAVGDQMTLFEQQQTLASEQTQMLDELGKAEKKAEILEKKAENEENIGGEILGTEEVLKIQGKVYKVTWCFVIQVMLLLLVLSLVIQLSPHRAVVVPT